MNKKDEIKWTLTWTVAGVAGFGSVDVRGQYAPQITAHMAETDPGGGLYPVASTRNAARRPLGPFRERLRTCVGQERGISSRTISGILVIIVERRTY